MRTLARVCSEEEAWLIVVATELELIRAEVVSREFYALPAFKSIDDENGASMGPEEDYSWKLAEEPMDSTPNLEALFRDGCSAPRKTRCQTRASDHK